MNKKVLILIIFLGIVLMGGVLIFRPSKPQPGNTPDSNQDYKKSFDEVSKNNSFYETKEKVAILITKLPYKGNNFTLQYSYPNNQFTLTLFKGKEDVGNQEFTQFLQNNHINDIKLLDNYLTKIE